MNTVIVASSAAAASLAATFTGPGLWVRDAQSLGDADIGRGTRLVAVLPLDKALLEAAERRARLRGAEVVYADIKGLEAQGLGEAANEPVEAA